MDGPSSFGQILLAFRQACDEACAWGSIKRALDKQGRGEREYHDGMLDIRLTAVAVVAASIGAAVVAAIVRIVVTVIVSPSPI